MRRFNASLALAAVACLGFAGAAQAHWHVGVYMGAPAPYYYPYGVPAPYYYAPYPPYPPPVVVVPDQPDTTYIERPQPGQGQDEQGDNGPQQGTWWYCDKTKSYYPYVKQCASGWREVPAAPPAPNR